MTVKRALSYARVSTDKQGEGGLGIESQQNAVRAYIDAHGWAIAGTYVEVASGKSADNRAQLGRAFGQLELGYADVLVVAKLDRLSRSLVDFAQMMARAKREGWSIVALDIGVDTSTLNGELVANIIMALAQWERQLIGQRVKAALDIAVERGTKMGRPSGVAVDTLAAIVARRAEGKSYAVIAASLNEAGVPTPQGGATWQKSTVRHLYERTLSDG